MKKIRLLSKLNMVEEFLGIRFYKKRSVVDLHEHFLGSNDDKITNQMKFPKKSIVIYTTSVCPYCVRAKALFDRKGLKYDEINVEEMQERNRMIEKAGGRRTVPQIFIGSLHVGGYDDLYALEKDGKLDEILN